LFRLGLIINPVAGMGGPVGLKGTDGEEVLRLAFSKGAVAQSPERASRVLKHLKKAQHKFSLLTCPGSMGGEIVRSCGLEFKTLPMETGKVTSPDHTRRAAALMMEHPVDLLLFAGGDGTARDIASAVGENQLCLGVPAGVKIHSSVYAISPEHAGEIVLDLIEGGRSSSFLAEVMDIDEEAFRADQLKARLYGYLKVPRVEKGLQALKTGSAATEKASQQAIAAFFAEEMDPETLYLIGPGSTTRELLQWLGQEGTLLGVDALRNGHIVKRDLNEKECLELLYQVENRATIVVTPIGGQGFIFGRGNQQFSPEVIRRVSKDHILVVATPGKMQSLQGSPFRLDTGDPEMDHNLCGIYRVLTGYREIAFYRAEK